jgi:hypothetical protein
LPYAHVMFAMTQIVCHWQWEILTPGQIWHKI